jgi:hypothetical protein
MQITVNAKFRGTGGGGGGGDMNWRISWLIHYSTKVQVSPSRSHQLQPQEFVDSLHSSVGINKQCVLMERIS